MTAQSAHAAPALSDRQRRMYRGSFFLFIIAETMIFVTLFSTRFLMAYSGHPDTVNQMNGIIVTALLVVSLWPMFSALSRARKGENAGNRLWLTALLGAIAIAFVVYDWATLGFSVGSRYGETYVLSTAYHAVHIALGVVGLAAVGSLARQGNYSAENHWPVEAGAIFWGFVVLTWVLLYVIFFQM